MENIDRAIKRLMSASELDVHQGQVTDDDVAELIRATNCVLPADYLVFLRRCGFASWEGHSVYGIYDFSDARFPKSYNFSALVQTARTKEFYAGDPYPYMASLVLIGKDGMGGFFLLISSESNSDGGVNWLSYDEYWFVTKFWESFSYLLEYLLSE